NNWWMRSSSRPDLGMGMRSEWRSICHDNASEGHIIMSHDIEVATRTRGDVCIIDIKGDLTTVTGERVEAVYQQLSTDGSKTIVLFFDKACYINSGGIATLIGMVSESMEREQVIRIAGLSDHFQKIFTMVGLTRYAAIFASEEAALEGF